MNDEPKPPVFDLAITRKLLNSVSSYGRLPGGEFVAKLAEQLRGAILDVEGAAQRIDRAQTEVLRYQRELETANGEMRLMREELISLRTRPVVAVPVPAVEAPKAKAAPASLKPRKKSGPKPRGKLVVMPDVQQKAQ